MRIGYPREKIRDLFLKARKKVVSIGIIAFTLLLTLIIHGIQTRKIEALSVKKGIEAKKNDALKEIAQTEKRINLYKSLFGNKDAASVMNAISNIARDSKVRVISLQPDKEINLPAYIKYPFNLVIAVNSFHDIGKFINHIENQPEAYFVDAMSISTQEESQGENKLTVNVTLSIIAFKG